MPIATWGEWLDAHELKDWILLPPDVAVLPWQPTDADRKAAWELYTEVRSRISTQPLPYRSGMENAALSSLVTLFDSVRKVLRTHGPDCRHTATMVIEALNVFVRPLTAKWHKLSEAGLLDAEDWRHKFRADLGDVQPKLRKLLRFLGLVAEGDAFRAGTQSGADVLSSRTAPLSGAILYDKLLGDLTPRGPSPRDGFATAADIIGAERREILRRRGAEEGGDVENLVGLAISGGGIRSATFAQGVLQGLAAKDLLRQVDLLSTVSGGGYIGAFLSSFLNSPDVRAAEPKIGLGRADLPFVREGACESTALRTLRNNSKFLLLRGFLGRLAMIWQGLYGVIMNFVIIAPAIIGAVLAAVGLHYDRTIQAIAVAGRTGQRPPLGWTDFNITLVMAAIWAAAVFLLALVQNVARLRPRWSAVEKVWPKFCTYVFAATIGVGLLQAIPVMYYVLLRASLRFHILATDLSFQPKAFAVLAGNVATFLTARGLLWGDAKPEAIPAKLLGWLRRIAFHVFWLSGPVLLVLVYFVLCHEIFVNRMADGWTVWSVPVGRNVILAVAFAVLAIYSWGLLNVNLISPHRYYRDRLAASYLLKADPRNRPAVAADDPQLLSTLGGAGKAPYHLINAALNLPTSRIADLRGRDADFFVFSKCFCGSPIVGYRATTDWEQYDGRLDLGTAMAISGAAASPLMGSTTPRGASFYLTLLNVRLGYWLRKPAPGIAPSWFVKAFGRPGPWYLFRELIGRVDERRKYLNVSDGGHIENLGVYELLRRRCKFIIAIDGEFDANLEFPSLMRLEQFAWIDFGIRIELDVALLRLTTRHFSQVHFAVGRILYPDDHVGYMLYIKLSVSGNESDFLLDYRARNPQFPHHPTTHQLFSESQFEAYRALGEHVTEDLFSPPLVQPEDLRSLTMEKWFQSLANHLLVT